MTIERFPRGLHCGSDPLRQYPPVPDPREPAAAPSHPAMAVLRALYTVAYAVVSVPLMLLASLAVALAVYIRVLIALFQQPPARQPIVIRSRPLRSASRREQTPLLRH